MRMKRSVHIPMLMRIAATKRMRSFVRKRFTQKSWGVRQLQPIMAQKMKAYGPVGRLIRWT